MDHCKAKIRNVRERKSSELKTELEWSWLQGAKTGRRAITVEEAGLNCILVIPGVAGPAAPARIAGADS